MSDANEMTAALLVEIPKRYPGVRIWRNNRIDAMALGAGGRLRRVKAGVDGQADLSGIGPGGVRIEIEVKAGRDKMSKSQIAFQAMILNHGGIYIEARDVDECMAALREEIRQRTRY